AGVRPDRVLLARAARGGGRALRPGSGALRRPSPSLVRERARALPQEPGPAAARLADPLRGRAPLVARARGGDPPADALRPAHRATPPRPRGPLDPRRSLHRHPPPPHGRAARRG